MYHTYDIVAQLTSETLEPKATQRLLREFSHSQGWRPSDNFDVPGLRRFATAHLLVEHGLENTAVLTFLRSPYSSEELQLSDQLNLLRLSYNNLVDWHVQIDHSSVSFVYNRTRPFRVVNRFSISRADTDSLRIETFEQVIGRRPSPNVPALDDALINTVSEWKRSLSAELGYQVSNQSLSALFNAIIFLRAVEDYRTRESRDDVGPGILLREWEAGRNYNCSVRATLLKCLNDLTKAEIPAYLIRQEDLVTFDHLDRDTVGALFTDFYRNRFSPYEYDFSVMSKHALSRVYEHYVSILHLDSPSQPQLSLFPKLPDEERNRAYGSVYTPQFIARFFARYLRDHVPHPVFQQMRTADPACGSGIFLRTLLELQCDLTETHVTSEAITRAFAGTWGFDVDPNACHAASLSLALLHLVLTGDLPPDLNIFNEEATGFLGERQDLLGSFDSILANPPFVPLDTQSDAMRERVRAFMGSHASGRIDLYLAFLLAGLRMLKPGGFGLFVIPHNFLLAENASGLRKLIADEAWVHCLADLSAIRVFESSASYVILLIFQKKDEANYPPTATIIKCQDQVSKALQDAADGVRTEGPAYSIYTVTQDSFSGGKWVILPPTEASISRRYEALQPLGEFVEVRLGFTSGLDKVFIVSTEIVPDSEREVFRPYLPDREMLPYKVPSGTGKLVFHPFGQRGRLSEDEIRDRFPWTWRYLVENRSTLEGRASVREQAREWWQPHRSPKEMFRPKIVTPHLVLVPRFALDGRGDFAVSHTPYLIPRLQNGTDDLLKYFLGILNSTACFWYVTNHSHLYARGYVRLEPITLKRARVPNPNTVSSRDRRRLIALVDQRLTASGKEALDLEVEIDRHVATLYGLNADERRAIGMDD